MEQIRIVEGNDFHLLVTLTQVQADGTRAPLSAQVLTDVRVNVIRSMSHRPLPMTHEVTDDGALLVDFEADKLPLGNYDIEIVAKYGDMDVRSCEARILAIVYDNGMANISPTIEGSKAYDVDMTFSIITANAEGGGTVIDPELANKVKEHEDEITILQNQIFTMADKIAILERRVTVLEGGEVTPEIESITLNPTEITMTVEGEQATIAAAIAPEGADLSALAWSIGDTGVINFVGEPTAEAATIAAVANGTTYVQLTAGEIVAECAVTVAIPEPEPDEPDEPIVPTGEWDMGGATTEGTAIDLGNATTEGEALDFGNANVE